MVKLASQDIEIKGTSLFVSLLDENERRRQATIAVMNACDAVTVSTDVLATTVRQYTTKPVIVVRNAIDVVGFQRSLRTQNELRHPYYKTVGWAGGKRSIEDLAPMLGAWNKLALESEDIKFIIAGWLPDLSKYPSLTPTNFIHIPWASIEDYGNGMQVDIGCVSVSNNDFAKCKSPIKAWEFALAGAMVIGSKVLYGDEPILYAVTEEDWYNGIKYYLHFPVQRYAMQVTYERFVKGQYDIEYNWVYWMDAYQKVLNLTGQENAIAPVQV